MSIAKRRRILIVDDERDVGLTLKVVLETYGFVVDNFTDPVVALKNFKPNLYDLFIIDIKMPIINGFELYSEFKSVSNNQSPKAIFVTALSELGSYENYKKCLSPKLGERHFIQKPISNIQLLNQVYSMVN